MQNIIIINDFAAPNIQTDRIIEMPQSTIQNFLFLPELTEKILRPLNLADLAQLKKAIIDENSITLKKKQFLLNNIENYVKKYVMAKFKPFLDSEIMKKRIRRDWPELYRNLPKKNSKKLRPVNSI